MTVALFSLRHSGSFIFIASQRVTLGYSQFDERHSGQQHQLEITGHSNLLQFQLKINVMRFSRLKNRSSHVYQTCIRTFRQEKKTTFSRGEKVRLTPVEEIEVAETTISNHGSLLVPPFIFTLAVSD